ncbi:MAG: dihydropyrimidinase [Anaerolineales bacterium]|nr:dihydropyrimidinase [Anaerolineales bacterium]MCX7609844.1 dihydropyrimidinase [Anaerolineales bacterium]MDW8227323.1 dihydropyrimidinase [Anaerolineales bacterium]
MSRILIKNGTLITDQESRQVDLLIEGEKIVAIEAVSAKNVETVVDASGKFILPGGIDPHTHFDLPMFGTVSSDDHYTGTKAAAFGGTTTVIDFVSLDFPTLHESVEAWREKAAKAAVDYTAHMNLTRFDSNIAAEIPRLPEWGIASLKVFTAYNNRLRLDDGSIFKALQIARQHDMLVLIHAENGDVIEVLTTQALAAGHTEPIWHARTRPAWGAVEATLRACALAAQADAPIYIVHMNAAGEVDMLRYARERGVRAMGETCPQYLFFTEEDLKRPDGAKWICSPPMRTSADNNRLWQGLMDGTLQTVGTDHCPFFFDGTKPILYEGKPVAIPGKELGKDDFTKIPNGLPGVQDRLPVLWTAGVVSGKLTPQQFVALTSTNPAKIFGLYPRKGALLPGSDADIVIWDPNKKVKYGVALSHQRTDYNLYEGWELTGYPEKVFLRGKLIVDGERWLGKSGDGQFLPRRSSGEFL